MKSPLPTMLIIVAVIFIMSGFNATWQVIALYFHGSYNINLTVLSTFIGLGLLWRQQIGRIFALIYSAFYVVEGAIFSVFFALSTHWLFLWGPLATLGIGVWQVWVLTREDVHQIFQRQDN